MSESIASRGLFLGQVGTALAGRPAVPSPKAQAESPTSPRPAQAWIIVAQNWEDADEGAFPTDGVHPFPKLYTHREDAEADCRKYSREFFGGNRPQAFDIDWDAYALDPETATWDDLLREGYPDPYFLLELET